MRRHRKLFIIFIITLAFAVALTTLSIPQANVASAAGTGVRGADLYYRPAPDFDLNTVRKLANARKPTADQLAAVEALKANAQASRLSARWNDFGGSPDVLMDFASAPYAGTPEEAGRAFLSANAVAFGINDVSNLRLVSERAMLGGHLLRFQQTYGGIDVKDGGVGLVMNGQNQIIMASGPHFRDVNVNTTPTLSAAQAKTAANTDLAKFHVSLPQAVQDLLRPGLEKISSQLSAVQNVQPKLGIYPTANGYRLVWKVATYSTNPFGLYVHAIDAHTGELVSRQDYVNFQNPTTGQPFTADVYPKYPSITPELKDQSIISVDPVTQIPLGQERVNLRKFDASNMATGVNGTLTGKHALVNNILATKLPFAQAAKGTWHFRKDDPANFEARTNERDHVGPAAEPAEHQDDINAFFFVTYLLEYVDHIHRAGDAVHNRVGQGSFPDSYPNSDVPLPATVHAPNIYVAINAAAGRLPAANADLPFVVLGLDNAVAFNLTGTIRDVTGEQAPVTVNPTIYGHGFLLNDLALEGTVPYHEGMHAITSPIAGLEGAIEGRAMNEGQADMWAFTITNNASLGDYVVNAKGYRDRLRSLGRDADSVAYIRSARSTLKYSDIGTLNNAGVFEFEEHRDGEIFMSTLWDIREMLNRAYPGTSTYKRPAFIDGEPRRSISNGTETFERIFLGAMYVLGTTSPDTMVKARDAMLVADQALYSSDPSDPSAPGQNRALIEQIFAAHELGINAREVTGEKATISTQVSTFTGAQEAPAVPQNVAAVPATTKSLNITWSPVDGAVAYEVLKRKTAYRNRREPNGRREYLDGDAQTTGWRHVAYVGANEASYEDRGVVEEVFAPAGLKNLFDSEYAVRAVRVNSNRQLGFSDLSGAAEPTLTTRDVTESLHTSIANVTFANSVFAFDNIITNTRGANSSDPTIFAPINFRIESISDPSVTVRNADGGANTFLYNKALAIGTSATKRFEFNNPMAKLFTFDAIVTGQVFAGSTGGNGSQTGDGSAEPPPTSVTYSLFKEEKTGTVIVGEPTGLTHGSGLIEDEEIQETDADPAFRGTTYVDIPVTTKSDASLIDITLSSTTAVDYDMEFLTADGKTRLVRSAANLASEHIRTFVTPNTNYIVRIIGFANVASDYKVVMKQYLPQGSANANNSDVTVNADGSETSASSGGVTAPLAGVVNRVVRFTVNPLTKSVSVRFLK